MSSCHSSQCGHESESSNEKQLREQLRRIGHKLLVMSGKGGVGKSSVAVYLSLGLSRLGYRVGLLDVDLHGPSIPRMLGLDGMFRVDDGKRMVPHSYGDNLRVISIQCLLDDPDSAVIWRGPVKHGVIRQFISDVNWGVLDYLIIDSPPGTGDEPLSVAQTMLDAQAVIVTTPQEVALADVRKSINFCRKVQMSILGLVENMCGYVCPHCNAELPLLGKGGGAKTAARMNVRLLGSLPFDPRVVEAGDVGRPLLDSMDGSPFVKAVGALVSEVVGLCGTPKIQGDLTPETVAPPDHGEQFKVAVPLAGGKLTNHFGHCEQFAVLNIKEGRIEGKELLTPPPHEPGVLPRWLGSLGVNLILAGGMGRRALGLFEEQNIRVITGVPSLAPEELIQQYLNGSLTTGANVCDH